MMPIYERYDALLTVSSAPAPRFDRISPLRSWIGANIHTVFNVTGGPALAQCSGYAASGLPLAMQVVGRPFDDAMVLRVANAYERATQWRSRRPALVPGAPRADVTPPASLTGAIVEPSVRAFDEQQVRRCGLKLTDMKMALLCEVAPYAMAMGNRVRRNFARSEELANVFRFPA